MASSFISMHAQCLSAAIGALAGQCSAGITCGHSRLMSYFAAPWQMLHMYAVNQLSQNLRMQTGR